MKEFYSSEDWKRIGKVKINITDKEKSIGKLKEIGLPT